MTDLKIRRIPFRFDEPVPFLWSRENPGFSVLNNMVSVIAVAFEKYIVAAVRMAMERIDDPDVLAEADAFLRQEAQHARAHRMHLKSLAEQYPGLQQVFDEAEASYDQLLEEESLEFHVGYIAVLEAMFTPLFKMQLDNKEALFGPGDARVASLFMWHYVEEIEHRSSALIICRAIAPDRFWRLKMMRPTFAHTGKLGDIIMNGFVEHVPVEDRGGVTAESFQKMWPREVAQRLPFLGRKYRGASPPTSFHMVPTIQLVRMAIGLLRAQSPWHNPTHQPLPGYADTWFAAYEEGEDMTVFEGAPA